MGEAQHRRGAESQIEGSASKSQQAESLKTLGRKGQKDPKII